MTIYENIIQFFLERERYYFDISIEKGEWYLSFLCESTVAKEVFLNKYTKLPAIEQMPEPQKKEMKQFVIEKFPGRSKEQMIEACKIIYTIGSLL